jgi:hypothetical protein
LVGKISCESKLTRVMSEIGSLELHFNSRDARFGKIGTLCGALCGARLALGWRPLGEARGEKSVTQFKVNGT